MSDGSPPPPGAVETTGPTGAPVRHYRVGLSAEALALGWARAEQGPALATVVVDQEVSPRGHHGRLWGPAAEHTLACAIVLRPSLRAEEADAVWMAGGVAATKGAVATGAASAATVRTFWPDSVVDDSSGDEVAMVNAETQLGPGQVRSAVVSLRFDLTRLGLQGRGDELLASVIEAMDEVATDLDTDAGGVAALYAARCALVGSRVKVQLLPKGESRGVVSSVDREGRLQLESGTGMIERLTPNQVRSLEVVT